MTRLAGSGAVPRAFALSALVVVTVFVIWWAAIQPDALSTPLLYIVEALALLIAVRSLRVGVFLDGDGVRVRGWVREFRYGPGEITAIGVVPYWSFLDKDDPILSLLKFTPASGWVREISATVSSKDRTLAQAAEIRRHLGVEVPA